MLIKNYLLHTETACSVGFPATIRPTTVQVTVDSMTASGDRKVGVRLPGKGNLNSHSARLVHLIITMPKWIRTGRLSINDFLSLRRGVTDS